MTKKMQARVFLKSHKHVHKVTSKGEDISYTVVALEMEFHPGVARALADLNCEDSLLMELKPYGGAEGADE